MNYKKALTSLALAGSLAFGGNALAQEGGLEEKLQGGNQPRQEQVEDLRVTSAEATLNKDISQVKDEYNIEVSYQISVRGGPSIYRLTDLTDGKVLGSVELRRTNYFPGQNKWLYHQGELQEKLGKILKTPKDQLKRLVKSKRVLYEDIKNLEKEMGISCYDPNALPLEERIPDGERQILYVTTEFFDGNFYSSSEQMGVVSVNVSEHIPGRTNYSEESVYQRGDLKKSIMQNKELFSAYVKRVLHNAQHSDENSFRHLDWDAKATELTK